MDRREFLTKTWWGMLMVLVFGRELALDLIEKHGPKKLGVKGSFKAIQMDTATRRVNIYDNQGLGSRICANEMPPLSPSGRFTASEFKHQQYGKSISVPGFGKSDIQDPIAGHMAHLSNEMAKQINKHIMDTMYPKLHTYELGAKEFVGLSDVIEMPDHGRIVSMEPNGDKLTVKMIQDAKVKLQGSHPDVWIWDDPISEEDYKYPAVWSEKMIEDLRKYEVLDDEFAQAIMNKPGGSVECQGNTIPESMVPADAPSAECGTTSARVQSSVANSSAVPTSSPSKKASPVV